MTAASARARRFAALAVLWLLAGRGAVADEAARYEDCLALAGQDAEAAYDSARRWQDEGGGTAARHCEASALLVLGHNREAALALEQLAQDVTALKPVLAAGLLGQAGRARLAAGQIERARAVQTVALALRPDDVDLLIDRSITLAAAEDYAAAVADLDRAASLAPERAEILVLRAAAYRKLGETSKALPDIARALTLEPDNAEARLERGILRQMAGDAKGARADWLAVLDLVPDGPSGAAARARLERLDVTVE